MTRSYDVNDATVVYLRPEAEQCASCGANLWVREHQGRFVQRLDGLHYFVRQGLACSIEACPGRRDYVRVPVDLRLVLPSKSYGTEIVIEVGERHLQHGDAFARVARELRERGVPLSNRHAGELFRSYVALTNAALGDEEEIRKRLRAQGGILLMADGVQFDNTSPVLYMVWDALSGTPLFGERKAFRSAEDLIPLLERVKAMEIDVIAIVSDKERGLVPAIADVFPNVPHQLCQLHFLKNCALGMKSALAGLKTSVESRADKAQRIAKRLHVHGWDSVESDPSSRQIGSAPITVEVASSEEAEHSVDGDGPEDPPAVEAEGNLEGVEDVEPKALDRAGCDESEPEQLSEEQLVVEFCAMARHASRATGRAPLNPPELVREEGLERVRGFVAEAVSDAKKGAPITPFLTVSTMS